MTGHNCHRIACGENNAMKSYVLVQSVLLGNRSWEQFTILFARVSLGVFFAISGGNKLFVPSRTRQMYETLAGAGIPLPQFMTYFISSWTSSAAACSSLDCFRACAAPLLSSRWSSRSRRSSLRRFRECSRFSTGLTTYSICRNHVYHHLDLVNLLWSGKSQH